jgi:hypothetical protein
VLAFPRLSSLLHAVGKEPYAPYLQSHRLLRRQNLACYVDRGRRKSATSALDAPASALASDFTRTSVLARYGQSQQPQRISRLVTTKKPLSSLVSKLRILRPHTSYHTKHYLEKPLPARPATFAPLHSNVVPSAPTPRWPGSSHPLRLPVPEHARASLSFDLRHRSSSSSSEACPEQCVQLQRQETERGPSRGELRGVYGQVRRLPDPTNRPPASCRRWPTLRKLQEREKRENTRIEGEREGEREDTLQGLHYHWRIHSG